MVSASQDVREGSMNNGHSPNEGEQVLLNEIVHRIETNRNVIIMVLGPTGEGKSYVQLRIGELVNKHFQTMSYLSFDPWHALKIGAKLLKAEVLNWDDIGATGMAARDAATVANKVMSYFLESFRYLQAVLTVSVPSLMMADITYRRLTHYVIVMMGIDYEAEQSLGMIHKWAYNPLNDVMMAMPLTYVDGNGYPVKVKGIWFDRPDEQVEKAYEKKKRLALDVRWKGLLDKIPAPRKIAS